MSIAHQISEVLQEMANVKAGLEMKQSLTADEMHLYKVCKETFTALKPLVNVYMDACDSVSGNSRNSYQRPNTNKYPNEDALAFGAGLAAAHVFSPPEHHHHVPQDMEQCQINEFHHMMSNLNLDDDN